MVDLTQFEGHTPGPWAYVDDRIEYHNVPGEHEIHFGPTIEADDTSVLAWPETTAKPDLNLLAAAPALFAEVKRLREALSEILIVTKEQNEPLVSDMYVITKAHTLARSALKGETE